jgi:hypothetical protein
VSENILANRPFCLDVAEKSRICVLLLLGMKQKAKSSRQGGISSSAKTHSAAQPQAKKKTTDYTVLL